MSRPSLSAVLEDPLARATSTWDSYVHAQRRLEVIEHLHAAASDALAEQREITGKAYSAFYNAYLEFDQAERS